MSCYVHLMHHSPIPWYMIHDAWYYMEDMWQHYQNIRPRFSSWLRFLKALLDREILAKTAYLLAIKAHFFLWCSNETNNKVYNFLNLCQSPITLFTDVIIILLHRYSTFYYSDLVCIFVARGFWMLFFYLSLIYLCLCVCSRHWMSHIIYLCLLHVRVCPIHGKSLM